MAAAGVHLFMNPVEFARLHVADQADRFCHPNAEQGDEGRMEVFDTEVLLVGEPVADLHHGMRVMLS